MPQPASLPSNIRMFGVTGWKNSGKTGLMVRLISEFTARGFSVASIKHAHHTFRLNATDLDGRHLLAPGATQTMIVSEGKWALVEPRTEDEEVPLAELIAQLAPVDLVLVEGYKRDRHPKIEAYRGDTRQDIIARNDDTIVAVAGTSRPDGMALPFFDLDDTAAIADFVMRQVGLD